MRDQDFLQKVTDSGEVFASGDMLLCDLRTIHRHTRRGIQTRYEVVRVLAHYSGRDDSLTAD